MNSKSANSHSANSRSESISQLTLSRIPLRHNRRQTVVLKFGGTTLGSSVENQRIKLARKTIAGLIEDGKFVIPVFSALRIGRSQHRDRFSVTDFLQNYHSVIRSGQDPERAANAYRDKLESVHAAVIKDLGLNGFADVEEVVSKEIDWICKTISATTIAYEPIPSLDDLIVTAGERIAIQIMSAYFNHCHQQGKFPIKTQPVSALELGVYTDNRFGSANIDWPRAIEHTRETIAGQYMDLGVMPVVSGFDGIYDKAGDFDEMVKSRCNNDGRSAASNVYRTSLGRGGSDLTATFLGLAMDADYVGFCKETPGVLTGDDLMVGESATTVPCLSYQLATEAGNIYSKAVAPVQAANVPIHIFDPADPEKRTIVSDWELPDGLYIIDRPKSSVNIHLASIPDEPGALVHFLNLFAEHGVNVEEIRHQRSGTDFIVCGDDSDVQASLDAIHEDGTEAYAHFSWYIRIIGNVTEELAAQFNDFMGRYEPLSSAAYQLNTKVVTATIARNRAVDGKLELQRISEILLELHNRFVVPNALHLEERQQREPILAGNRGLADVPTSNE